MEEFELQGIFVNVIALYWKKDCNITLGKLKRRYRSITNEQWNSLINN